MTRKTSTSPGGAPAKPTLYFSLDLSSLSLWRVVFTLGPPDRHHPHTVTAGRFKSLAERIATVKRQVALPPGSVVKGCYQTGPGGFTLHRYLESIGVQNIVVAPAGAWDPLRGLTRFDEPLDADTLLDLLVRYDHGERDVWSVLDTSSKETESLAMLSDELEDLRDRRQGARDYADEVLRDLEIDAAEIDGPTLQRLAAMPFNDGRPVEPSLRRELRFSGEKLTLLDDQIREVRKRIEATQAKLEAAHSDPPAVPRSEEPPPNPLAHHL